MPVRKFNRIDISLMDTSRSSVSNNTAYTREIGSIELSNSEEFIMTELKPKPKINSADLFYMAHGVFHISIVKRVRS